MNTIIKSLQTYLPQSKENQLNRDKDLEENEENQKNLNERRKKEKHEWTMEDGKQRLNYH